MMVGRGGIYVIMHRATILKAFIITVGDSNMG